MGDRAPYRSHFQIVADVLSVVSEGARKTHIMYRANLSYSLLNRYLSKVLSAGLVRLGDEGWYEITDKGHVFLDRCNEFFEEDSRIREQVINVEDKKEELESLLSL